MKKATWIVFAFFALRLLSSFSQELADKSNWQAIDCGNDEILFNDSPVPWNPDIDYTKTGSNKQVRTKTTRDELNTLRAFPSKVKDNCYNVPIETQTLRYIIRVGFYYGNYDGLFKPPVFNLFLNNIKWTTVDTSIYSGDAGEPFYEEIIYQNKGSGFFKICLVQIKDGGIPIINSIETMVIYDELYPKMETNATYNLVARINFGGPEVRYGIDNNEIYNYLDTDEIYNRIWSRGVTPYTSTFGFIDTDSTTENRPPPVVMETAIKFSASDPITLITDLPQLAPQSAYIVLYITHLGQPYYPNTSTSTLNIEINNQDQGKVETLSYNGEIRVITKYPVMVSGPILNITLLPTDDVSLPPTIAAMEVFTKWNTDRFAAARQYFSFACSMIILFMLFFVA